MTPVFFFILNWQYRLFAKIDVYCMFEYLLIAFLRTKWQKQLFLTQISQRYETSLLKKKTICECYCYGSVSAVREKCAYYVPNFFWNLTVNNRFDFFGIPQLFWRPFVLCSMKIVSFWSQPIFLTSTFHWFYPQSVIFWQLSRPSWN